MNASLRYGMRCLFGFLFLCASSAFALPATGLSPRPAQEAQPAQHPLPFQASQPAQQQ